jgi:hypothetical protein
MRPGSMSLRARAVRSPPLVAVPRQPLGTFFLSSVLETPDGCPHCHPRWRASSSTARLPPSRESHTRGAEDALAVAPAAAAGQVGGSERAGPGGRPPSRIGRDRRMFRAEHRLCSYPGCPWRQKPRMDCIARRHTHSALLSPPRPRQEQRFRCSVAGLQATPRPLQCNATLAMQCNETQRCNESSGQASLRSHGQDPSRLRGQQLSSSDHDSSKGRGARGNAMGVPSGPGRSFPVRYPPFPNFV